MTLAFANEVNRKMCLEAQKFLRALCGQKCNPSGLKENEIVWKTQKSTSPSIFSEQEAD